MQNDHMRKLLFLHNQSTIFTKDMNMKSKYLYSQEILEGGSLCHYKLEFRVWSV